MMKQLLCCLSLLLSSVTAIAQDSFTCRAQRYVAQYAEIAIAEQKRAGVPASVTLAQGIHESESGKSELVTKGNNHFGIKCKGDYCGPKVIHDDDRPREAFMSYSSAEASFKDHSDYLHRNRRYDPLFTYEVTDYKSWARGLKRFGYATNPVYAERIIKLIEDLGLQQYTIKGLNAAETPKPKLPDMSKAVAFAPQPGMHAPINVVVVDTDSTAQPITVKQLPTAHDTRFDSGKVIVVNGLKAFYANAGEMLLQYAVKYNMRYQRLLDINDLPDAALKENTLIYLERKHNEGTHAKHTVKEGETMLQVAQAEGIVLKRLLALNMMEPNDEPATGTILELQNGATRKPTLRATPPADLKTANNLSFVAPTPPDQYLRVDHSKTADTAKTVFKKEVNRDIYVTTIKAPVDSSALAKTDTFAKTDTVIDELSSLKQKLDKVVYPQDNSMVKVDTPVRSVPIKLTPITEEPASKPHKREPKTAAAPKATGYYVVKKGDNLYGIAQRQHTTVKEILKLNDIEPDDLRLGQKLKVPGDKAAAVQDGEQEDEKKPVAKKETPKHNSKGPVYYTVKSGDNLSNIAKRQGTNVKDILSLNDIDADALHLGQKLRIK